MAAENYSALCIHVIECFPFLGYLHELFILFSFSYGSRSFKIIIWLVYLQKIL